MSISQNAQAFLNMIAYSEGTSTIPGSDNGYNVLVGSTVKKPLLFTSYADHPRVFNKQLNSTAAGRYQLLERYYDYYKKILRLPDFTPASQDMIALRQLQECDAMPHIERGDIYRAVAQCCHIWASLPGNTYGQHQNSMTALASFYMGCGGKIA